MGFDLHIHSFYSDGINTPTQLVEEAKRKGMDGIALTDHDTLDGLREGIEAAASRKLIFVPGIELTTDYGKIEAHILGYSIDINAPRLRAKLELILASREERVREILLRLKRHQVLITWEDVMKESKSRFVGRSHVFRAMEKRGYVDRMRRNEVFEFYLGKDGTAYVPHREIETEEALDLVLESGGVPVLAHPGRVGADEPVIVKLVAAGLKGLEVYYPTHGPEQVAYYLNMAQKYRLIVTGGSDYHGKAQPRMGEAQIDELPFPVSFNYG